jgi:hypothetical protein
MVFPIIGFPASAKVNFDHVAGLPQKMQRLLFS